jgi:hypothetical protein
MSKQLNLADQYGIKLDQENGGDGDDDGGGGKNRTANAKQKVIRALFKRRNGFSWRTDEVRDPIVRYPELNDVINELKVRICGTNSANFFYFTSVKQANAAWPMDVFAKGYTGIARLGDHMCFEFVRVPEGQTTPFVPVQGPDKGFKPVVYTSSAPENDVFLNFKREDEVRMVSVMKETLLLQNHWAWGGVGERPLRYIQAPIRCGGWGEIDAIYKGEVKKIGSPAEKFLVVVEAKTSKADLFVSQLYHHAGAAFALASEGRIQGIDIDTAKVVCIGVKACGPSQLYLVQYKPVSRFDLEKYAEKSMQIESRTVYEFNPKVCGIGGYGLPKKVSKPKVDKRQQSLALTRK